MTFSRRTFLEALLLAPAVVRTYFDLGPAWRRHASGLVVPVSQILVVALPRLGADLEPFAAGLGLTRPTLLRVRTDGSAFAVGDLIRPEHRIMSPYAPVVGRVVALDEPLVRVLASRADKP